MVIYPTPRSCTISVTLASVLPSQKMRSLFNTPRSNSIIFHQLIGMPTTSLRQLNNLKVGGERGELKQMKLAMVMGVRFEQNQHSLRRWEIFLYFFVFFLYFCICTWNALTGSLARILDIERSPREFLAYFHREQTPKIGVFPLRVST
jgi:hypothetical protein